ncbi:hypothetical protein THASP1DRAFT_32008 [Thamnocephalis sphaerospora]|uniref:Uncharacterized protein n=1 Tax=Thamnocephalis sphaerospora TaxID=78915 RepID=A0A4P9XK93_9FUNG|nr:hypothetical protein THASP1DRAFT_32008 [Thamnocephalis sphaerospora]|eukprot:RKP06166.1 hypothetical protein THASP1DRAFT_32008 [Thamnocephalis sphaerospora]
MFEVVVPAYRVRGICSAAPVDRLWFNVTAQSPGLHGVYTMPRVSYDRIANLTSKTRPVAFWYVRNFTCASDQQLRHYDINRTRVSSCLTSSSPNIFAVLPKRELICVVAINTLARASVGVRMRVYFADGEMQDAGNGTAAPLPKPSTASSSITRSTLAHLEIWRFALLSLVVIAAAVSLHGNNSIPGGQMHGQCTNASVDTISLDVNITAGPGLEGVYVVKPSEYDKLSSVFPLVHSNGQSTGAASDRRMALFDYFIMPSCISGEGQRVSKCFNGDRTSEDRHTPRIHLSTPQPVCIALVNANIDETVTAIWKAEFTLDDGSDSAVTASSSRASIAWHGRLPVVVATVTGIFAAVIAV